MATANTIRNDAGVQDLQKHPTGLYVLFGTEMWERFSFYSMLALFTLYLRNPDQGFGWTAAEATTLYSTYLFFVYFSPLVGGFLADWKLGYRRAVMIGGVFFMAGHGLLSFRSLPAVYAALTCLVIGNGFFKPNVSTMVGNLYPEGSHLKDRAYNIFYMGINVGAASAPIVMEIVKAKWGYHPAFAVAAFGMLISVGILWKFKHHVERPAGSALDQPIGDVAPVMADAPPQGVSRQGKGKEAGDAHSKRAGLMDAVPEWKRIMALIVIFIIVIVFWMVFHQNGSTLTYWADDNTAWDVSGTIANAINPLWIIILTFPLVWFWKWLDQRGMEPSTPTKMAIGMFLTALSFYILFAAARAGESYVPPADAYATGNYRITERAVGFLKADGVPDDVLAKLQTHEILGKKFATDKEKGSGEAQFTSALDKALGPQAPQYRPKLMERAFIFRVSPMWLILAYMVISLGELMLSPMGLSLVSKVAPIRVRGLMMGGWFVATAMGNKLTMIGVFWERWMQSSFFVVLGTMALIMAFVLLVLLRPLKKAMPGV
ncbi:MAG: proton-dependent oligopeptide transporter, family [Blastocatellia bacterium]|jgi:POT family proton-dependent oligopeptide transporter|nr:proton-dependent oligopeptide transporter, family [Blastocatellia bacterium]